MIFGTHLDAKAATTDSYIPINKRCKFSIMNRLIILCTFSLLINLAALAQDKNDIAKVYYTKSETAFSEGQTANALNYVKLAEENLGSANTKTLRLKIAILNQLASKDNAYLNELDMALEMYFVITDKAKTDESIYFEILGIHLDVKQRIKEMESIPKPAQGVSRQQVVTDMSVPKITITEQTQGLENCENLKAIGTTNAIRGIINVRCVLTGFGDEQNLTIRILRTGPDSDHRFVNQSRSGDNNCRMMDMMLKKSGQLTFVVLNSSNRALARTSITVN
jgi:hypothetical protein